MYLFSSAINEQPIFPFHLINGNFKVLVLLVKKRETAYLSI